MNNTNTQKNKGAKNRMDLGKLHMLDRTQAAVFAWQQGLVTRRDP